MTELGIGRPETQFPVRLSAGVAWTDLRVGCHVFEFDGRVKYRRIDQGGVAQRPAEEVVWEERNREREILGEGLGVSRVIWNELFGTARDRLKQRLLHRVRRNRAAVSGRRCRRTSPSSPPRCGDGAVGSA